MQQSGLFVARSKPYLDRPNGTSAQRKRQKERGRQTPRPLSLGSARWLACPQHLVRGGNEQKHSSGDLPCILDDRTSQRGIPRARLTFSKPPPIAIYRIRAGTQDIGDVLFARISPRNTLGARQTNRIMYPTSSARSFHFLHRTANPRPLVSP